MSSDSNGGADQTDGVACSTLCEERPDATSSSAKYIVNAPLHIFSPFVVYGSGQDPGFKGPHALVCKAKDAGAYQMGIVEEPEVGTFLRDFGTLPHGIKADSERYIFGAPDPSKVGPSGHVTPPSTSVEDKLWMACQSSCDGTDNGPCEISMIPYSGQGDSDTVEAQRLVNNPQFGWRSVHADLPPDDEAKLTAFCSKERGSNASDHVLSNYNTFYLLSTGEVPRYVIVSSAVPRCLVLAAADLPREHADVFAYCNC